MTWLWAVSAIAIIFVFCGAGAFVTDKVLPKFPKVLKVLDEIIEKM